MRPSKKDLENAAQILLNGGIGVMPTDTIYGVVGSALSCDAVEQIYRVRRHDTKKPFIILIAGFEDLKRFGFTSARMRTITKGYWPGKNSLIFSVPKRMQRALAYLHRGSDGLAFRVPKLAWLRKFLAQTGPLTAPSANLSGQPPAETIREAKRYFGNSVDFYVDAGLKRGKPSKIFKVQRNILISIR